jgi:tRNA(Ile)-lysidine synthase
MKETSLTTAVRRALQEAVAPAPGRLLVVAFSGGPDSVALLDALNNLAPSLGHRLVAAHLDHRLRPESADDRGFCAAFCAARGVPLVTGTADVAGRARREGKGLEAAARAERRGFLRQVLEQHGGSFVVLGHTRDDQAETFLLRLLRGAGRSGLSAMRPRSARLLRPLLEVSRAEVLEHLRLRGLAFRDDASNRDHRFARNRVRHELLPYLEAHFNPRLRETLARSARLVAEEARFLERTASRRAKVGIDGDASVLPVADLVRLPDALARVALREGLRRGGGLRGISERHVERLLRLARSGRASGRRLSLPGGREARFSFGELRISTVKPDAVPFAESLSVPGRVVLPEGGAVLAGPSAGPIAAGDRAAVVAVPDEPLLVRSRRPGDRIGVGGREISLRRYLMARRVPAARRDRLPLVAAGPKVLWVPGLPCEAPCRGTRLVSLRLEGV